MNLPITGSTWILGGSLRGPTTISTGPTSASLESQIEPGMRLSRCSRGLGPANASSSAASVVTEGPERPSRAWRSSSAFLPQKRSLGFVPTTARGRSRRLSRRRSLSDSAFERPDRDRGSDPSDLASPHRRSLPGISRRRDGDAPYPSYWRGAKDVPSSASRRQIWDSGGHGNCIASANRDRRRSRTRDLALSQHAVDGGRGAG